MVDAMINNVRAFMTKFKLTYPALYDSMFVKGFTSVAVNTHLRTFVTRHNIKHAMNTSGGASLPILDYIIIWNYINDNQDKHEWWML